MYQINDYIVYKNGGVCRIEDIGVPCFLKTKELYYKISPLSNVSASDTIYVKTTNEELMRSIISKSQAEEYLDSLSDMDGLYSENDKVRDKEFRDILKSCEFGQCLRMFKGITQVRKQKIESGKKLSLNDDKNLFEVEKLLNIEFSTVLNISLDQVKQRIANALF